MKIISKIFVILINISLIIESNSIWASSLPRDEYFTQNWAFEKLVEKTDGKSLLQVKLFKRYMWINKTPISVAETSFTYLKNPQDTISLTELSEKFLSTFPTNTLKLKNTHDGIRLEGYWKNINRYVRIDLLKVDNQLIIINSFVRNGLKNALLPEVNQLHALLQTYRGNLNTKTSFFNLFNFLISTDAYAAPALPTGAGLGGLLGASNNPTITINSNSTITVPGLDALNTNLGNINTTVGGTNTALTGVGTGLNNLADSNNNLSTTLKDTNTSLTNQGQQVNDNLAKMNTTASTQGARFNDNWAESNKIAAKMMDPNHMAKLAFYTAAGAALGSLAVNLAVEGISTGIGFIFELFTGTKKKKLDWEDFQKAIQTWDSQQSELAKMETAVDDLILAFDFFQDKNMGNDYVANLQTAMQDMSFDRDIYLEKFADKNQSLACRRIFHNAAEELSGKLKEYEKIIEFSGKNKLASDNKESYFCSQLKEMQRKILSSEAQMQALRLAILKAESQFYAKDGEAKEKTDSTTDEINHAVTDTAKKREEYNKKSRTRLVDEYNKKRDEWVGQCKDQKNTEGKNLREELGFFKYLFSSTSRCREIYVQNNPIPTQDPVIAQTFEEESKLRDNLSLNSNSSIDFKLSQEQMNWFTRMHMDAFCYQFAHGPKDKIPAKCSEFPEMLYSLSMSKGQDKAAAAYKDKCEGRYVQGIRRLAGTP